MDLLAKIMMKLYTPDVGRSLWEEELENHLPQSKPSPIPVAWPQMSVIRMNSTCLECVDLNFLRKGFASFGFTFMSCFFT